MDNQSVLPPALQEFLFKQWMESRRNNTPTFAPRGGFGFSGSRDAQQWDSPSVYAPRKRWMYPPSGSIGPDQQMYTIPNYTMPFGFDNNPQRQL